MLSMIVVVLGGGEGVDGKGWRDGRWGHWYGDWDWL